MESLDSISNLLSDEQSSFLNVTSEEIEPKDTGLKICVKYYNLYVLSKLTVYFKIE